MSLYNYFPTNYQNAYQNAYQNPYQFQQLQQIQQMQQQQQQQQQQQPLTSGYVTVRTEEEARNYPVAPGMSVTFFNETQPFCYRKTMGNSPLDKNDFRVYKITEISDASQTQNLTPTPNEAQQSYTNTTEQFKAQIDTILGEIETLKRQVAELQAKKTVQPKKIKEVDKDEPTN